MAKIILNADDFGFDEDTCKATIDCFERGALTSATIMVNCPASELAIDYARKNPQFSYGVHLTYVDSLVPMLDAHEIPSLQKNGFFYDSNDVRKKALFFLLSKDEIIKESLAQIKVLLDAGIKVSHLDSHGHLHKFPSFLSALSCVTNKCRISRVRRVQNIFLESQHVCVTSILNTLFGLYIDRKYKTTDIFYMPANSHDQNWSEQFLRKIEGLNADTTIEIGVHPGYMENWRKMECQDIQHVSKLIRASAHSLITWDNIC